MKVVVVGGGAVGSFIAAMLALSGHETTILARRPVAAGRAALIALDDDAGRRDVAVPRVVDAAAVTGTPELVVLAVKMFDLAGALAGVAGWPEAPVLTVQNGVGAEAIVAEGRASALIAGSLTTAVEPTDDGVRRLRAGGIGLAGVRGDVSGLVASLAEAFIDAGLRARVFDDAVAMKWSKLVANLVGNASSALLDLDPAAVYADPALFRIERRQLVEAVDVMRALGVRPVALPGANVPLLLRGVRLPESIARPVVQRAIGGARGGKSPSLRLHFRGGGNGPTEVRWLNGAVVDAGERLGVATPVNAVLTELVELAAGDPAAAQRFRGHRERLVAAVAARDQAA